MADEYMGVGPGVAMTYRQVQPAEVGPFLIPLVGGKWVKLFGTFPLTQEAWDGFLNVLNVMKDGLREESLTAESEGHTPLAPVDESSPDRVLADYIDLWPLNDIFPPMPPRDGYPRATESYHAWCARRRGASE